MGHSILRLSEVSAKTGLARSTIYERIKDESFPKPISLGDRAVGFLAREVEEWIEARIAESRGDSRERRAA